MSAVIESREGAVVRLTLDRPEVLNALDLAMAEGLIAALRRAAADSATRCVVIGGASTAFCSGGDVRMFAPALGVKGEERRARFRAVVEAVHPIIVLLRQSPAPVLASVRGAAAGFGFSLALACDLVIAAESAYFTLAYSRMALSPDGGSTFFLPRHIGLKRATELDFFAERISAARALELGIINRVVADDDLEAATADWAERLARGPARAFANTRALLDRSMGTDLESHLAAEAERFADCATTADFEEAVAAFLAKREPVFRGA
ncbi:MAG: enoyl-CoA hydratase [Alphaproteobacteria bacterium]|nr:enoyl-CoA hydratase [Alphaproteobacteria bacterium]